MMDLALSFKVQGSSEFRSEDEDSGEEEDEDL